jgi:hypothetical protein
MRRAEGRGDPAAIAAVRVIRQITYVSGHGGTFSYQKIEGKLTECMAFGLHFYVREANDPTMSFYVSSGERWGMKHTGISRRIQILELCCDRDCFTRLTELVSAADPLHRPVRSNRRFTPTWAEKQFELRATRTACHRDGHGTHLGAQAP